MSLSSREAAESLSQAEAAGRRSAQAYFYHRSSPHLIMWGVIWVIGYGGTGFYPQYSDWLWGALILIGCLGGVVISRYSRVTCEKRGPYAWRMAALFAIILFFVEATYAVLEPHHARQFAAYPALITGSVYMALGLWVGMRYLISGMAVVALTLIGYFYIDWIFFWFAIVGGTSMILTGLWFRTV